ncbi:hypothetical protein F5Y11DRAFT_367411 [Daldinia sp. FL1419]|nr:hypothetical protein F5Y11DRAFT_367411 [Daldinia sp. FL1419]
MESLFQRVYSQSSAIARHGCPIEQMFIDLGNPIENDKNCHNNTDELDAKYRRVLQHFLAQTASSPVFNTRSLILQAAVSQVLKCNHSLHVAFVNRLARMEMFLPLRPSHSYEYYFFWACQWICEGRKLGQPAQSRQPTEQGRYRNGRNYINRGNANQINHDKAANDDKSDIICLIRIVSLIDAFLASMENKATSLKLKSCREVDGIIMLEEYPLYMSAMGGEYVTQKFPFDSFREERHAVATRTDQYASELKYLIGPLERYFLDALCKDFEIVTILVKNARLPLFRIYEHGITKSNMMEPHYILRLTLRSGKKLAVDLAGGRYGWDDKVMGWDRYERERVWKVIDTTNMIPADFRQSFIPAAQSVIIHKRMLEDMIIHIDYFIHMDQGTASTLKIIKDVDAEEWNDWQKGIVDEAADHMGYTLKSYQLSRHGFLYPTPEFNVFVTVEPLQYVAMSHVWLEDDYDSWIQDESKDRLKDIWNARLEDACVRFKHHALLSE